MNKEEYLKGIEKCKIDNIKMEEIEAHYGTTLNESIGKAISFANDSIFIAEERRVLSFEEITTLDTELPCDLASKEMIPLIDCYDNTYIVYVIKENKWAKYNTSDDILFKKRDTLQELL